MAFQVETWMKTKGEHENLKLKIMTKAVLFVVEIDQYLSNRLSMKTFLNFA